MYKNIVKKGVIITEFIPNHFNTQMYERAFNTFTKVPLKCSLYNTQQIREDVVLKDPKNLQFVANHFKTRELCEKALDRYPYPLEDACNCHKTQEMCQKVIDRYQYEQKLFPYQYNGQDMLKSFVSWKPFILEY